MSLSTETSLENTNNAANNSFDLHPANPKIEVITIPTDPKTNESQSISNINSTRVQLSDMDMSPAIATNSVNSQATTNIKEYKDSSEEHVESLTSTATAFTISFGNDEDNKAIKRFGLRDSIRKFAPPKPDTIERPRSNRGEQEQQSLTSMQSAPPDFSKYSPRSINQPQYSRNFDQSEESNVSDSVAFLIDKMLNCNKKNSATTECRKNSSSDDILLSGIDYCENGSDNGTYVVGVDPETDVARHKIDELFGVVKAAEASVMANLNSNKQSSRGRSNDRKQHSVNRDRPNHRNHHSRSSSSSRQDSYNVERQRQPRATSRHSTNTSSRQRRSMSQSSRQSYQRDNSDCDSVGTRSSRSSLHQDANSTNLSINKPSDFASMKFNRTFDLRRARLGLGEPTLSRVNQQIELAESLNLSRNMDQKLNSNTFKAQQQKSPASSCDLSGNFSRQDGGRYSLRTKNAALPNKLNSAHYHQNQVLNRSPQHNIIDQHRPQHYTPHYSPRRYQSSKNSPLPPCQSSDELETSLSMSTKYKSRIQQQQQHRKELLEVDGTESYHQPVVNVSPITGNHENILRNRSVLVQPGALDSLVISAVTSLSVKIHQSVCGVLIEQAKRLPQGNETRLVVEEILPQLQASPSSLEPTSVEDIDQLLALDLTKTLKNLKKVEQMVEVISQISNQLPFYTNTD